MAAASAGVSTSHLIQSDMCVVLIGHDGGWAVQVYELANKRWIYFGPDRASASEAQEEAALLVCDPQVPTGQLAWIPGIPTGLAIGRFRMPPPSVGRNLHTEPYAPRSL